MGEKNGNLLPCVYALLSGKSKKVYAELFKELKRIVLGDLDPLIASNHLNPKICFFNRIATN